MTSAVKPVPQSDPLQTPRQVIDLEIAGLSQLRDALDTTFLDVIDLLLATTGRLIVTGMGKSGHVARKIAATLASTGTPAQYVHPGEASHGDLGMITRQDAVLALSNMGETAEMADLITYTSRFGIRLVAMTSVSTSTLARAANLVLLLPKVEEACRVTSAPTTSTTMMLALGDALAVTLLERRGFGSDDFRTFHPGGTLGRSLLRVSAVMHRNPLPLVDTSANISTVIDVMTKGGFGCAGVTGQGGELAGIITDGDLRRHISPGIMSLTAAEIMTSCPVTAPPGILAADALRIMTDRPRQISALFVVEDSKPLGLLHMSHLLQAGFT
jgi:arabinose-5-phosphate isomerase